MKEWIREEQRIWKRGKEMVREESWEEGDIRTSEEGRRGRSID